jgi:hypothetical protein
LEIPEAAALPRLKGNMCGDQSEYWEVEGNFIMGFLGLVLFEGFYANDYWGIRYAKR